MTWKTALESMRESFERREAEEAAAAGVSLAQYRATQAAVEEQQRRAEQFQAACDLRERRLAPMLAGLRPAASEAVIRDDLEPTRAVQVVRRWLRDREAKRPILVLCGETGTGKTVACAVAIVHGGGEYVRANELASRHEPYSGDLSRGVKPLHTSKPALLVLDDVGTERTNRDGSPDARFAPALLEVFDQRQGTVRSGARRVPQRTLITTNLSEAAFLERYATEKRIKSRLGQIAYFCSCGDEDRRQS